MLAVINPNNNIYIFFNQNENSRILIGAFKTNISPSFGRYFFIDNFFFHLS